MQSHAKQYEVNNTQPFSQKYIAIIQFWGVRSGRCLCGFSLILSSHVPSIFRSMLLKLVSCKPSANKVMSAS